MPRISSKRRAILMTRSDTWTTSTPNIKSDENADFCLNRCPNKETPCDGYCIEYKQFKERSKKRNQ